MNTFDNELKKVAAATTLCHLCTLQQLENWVAETHKKKNLKTKKHENKNNQGDTDHAG